MNNLPEEFNKNSQFSEIKKLWNKLKVTNIYQEMFISLTIHYNQKKRLENNRSSIYLYHIIYYYRNFL